VAGLSEKDKKKQLYLFVYTVANQTNA
jgi:hypothetical protein